jgi:hypothetical protein
MILNDPVAITADLTVVLSRHSGGIQC